MIHRSLRALVSTPERRLLLIALATRLVPAALIFGSEDVAGSWAWAQAIEHGTSPYRTAFFPVAWPPLWLPFAWLADRAAEATGIPFHLVVKSIPIAADVILTFLLYSAARDYGRAPFRTALLYALNPVAIYMSAIHGNFDAIPTLCATSAVIALRIDDDRRQRRAATWLGVGAAFKTWPLFILPALVAPLKSLRRRAAVVAIACGIFAAALFVPSLFVGSRAIEAMLWYRGKETWWGLSSLSFLLPAAIPASVLTAIFYAAMTGAALLLFVAPAPAARGALLILLTFLATTPGFGVQHLLWIVPIALLADPRRGVVYSILAGCTLLWEVLLRPYTGHAGDIVRNLPHVGFSRAYGHGADQFNTVVDRLALWAFVCYWWVATIVSIARARRREDGHDS